VFPPISPLLCVARYLAVTVAALDGAPVP
jgi:hypothetical protein